MFIGSYIIYSYIIYIYNMIFCSCSFSLMFYGINFLRPASSYFLYLVSKGRSAGCARNDNSVSFHHAMFAHQCRNSEKYGINFFPYSSYWVKETYLRRVGGFTDSKTIGA